jgi:hypothetical protein
MSRKSNGAPIHRPQAVVDTTDDELIRFFSREYALGLHCSLGHAGTGGGGKLPDGWNSSVSFAIPGPAGFLEVTRVATALRQLGGPPPPAPAMPTRRRANANDHEKLARWRKLALMWPSLLPALVAHFSPRPGIGHVTEGQARAARLACVCPLTPTAREVTAVWMRSRCEAEVKVALAAASAADAAVEDRMDRDYVHDRELRKFVEVHYAFNTFYEAQRDLEGDIRRLWARQPLPSDVTAALLKLHEQTESKDKPTRERAVELEATILREARHLLSEARAAYARERKKIDQAIWTEHDRKKAERKRLREAGYETKLQEAIGSGLVIAGDVD